MCIKVPHEPPKLTKLHIVFMKASNFVQIAKKKKTTTRRDLKIIEYHSIKCKETELAELIITQLSMSCC